MCQDYKPPEGYKPIMINPNVDFTEFQKKDKSQSPSMNDILVPFLACGDLSGFDAYVANPQENSNNGKQEIVQ